MAVLASRRPDRPEDWADRSGSAEPRHAPVPSVNNEFNAPSDPRCVSRVGLHSLRVTAARILGDEATVGPRNWMLYSVVSSGLAMRWAVVFSSVPPGSDVSRKHAMRARGSV